MENTNNLALIEKSKLLKNDLKAFRNEPDPYRRLEKFGQSHTALRAYISNEYNVFDFPKANVTPQQTYYLPTQGKAYLLCPGTVTGFNGIPQRATLIDVTKVSQEKISLLCALLDNKPIYSFYERVGIQKLAELAVDKNLPNNLRAEVLDRYAKAGLIMDLKTGRSVSGVNDIKEDVPYTMVEPSSISSFIGRPNTKLPIDLTRTGKTSFKSRCGEMTEKQFEEAFKKANKPKMPGLLARIFSSDARREYRTRQTLFERKLYYAKRAGNYHPDKPKSVETWERRMMAFAHRLVDEERIETQRNREDYAVEQATHGRQTVATNRQKFMLASFDKLMNDEKLNHYSEIVDTPQVQEYLSACQEYGEAYGGVKIDELYAQARIHNNSMFRNVKYLMENGPVQAPQQAGGHMDAQQRQEVARTNKQVNNQKSKEQMEKEIGNEIRKAVRDPRFEDAVVNFSKQHSAQFTGRMRSLCNDPQKIQNVYGSWKKNGDATLQKLNSTFTNPNVTGKVVPTSSSAAYEGPGRH